MTSFRKYFIYHFKTTFLRLVMISLLSALLVSTSVWHKNYSWFLSQNTYTVSFAALAIVAAVISTVIPILELLPFKNRRNLDTILFLPIDHRKMAAVHFINGALHIFIINLICFSITFGILTNHSYPFKTGNFVLLFLFTIFGSLAIYAFTLFIFDRANTTADGVIWLISYSFIGAFTFAVVADLYTSIFTEGFVGANDLSFPLTAFSPYFLFVFLWSTVNRILIPKYNIIETATSAVAQIEPASSTPELIANDIIGMIFWGFLIPLCIFGFIWMFKKKRPENIGSVSNSWFGYKVLLPLTAITVLTGFQATLENIVFHAIVLVCLVIGYIIYRKGVHFRPSDYIFMSLSMILPTLLNNLR